MTQIHLRLTYPELSRMIQAEANKQEINVKGYDIKLDKLVINAVNGRLRVTSEIVSKWNAYFDFSAIPHFIKEENKLDLREINLDLDAQNFIFKGILKLAKGNIKSRIEKIIEQPITEQLETLKATLDKEISKAPLPHGLAIASETQDLNILGLVAEDSHLNIDLEIKLKLNIAFLQEQV